MASGRTRGAPDDTTAADAVTDAVLTASRLLMTVSATSIAEVDETMTIPQFRVLVVLHSRGPMKLSAMAELLGVDPSTTTRMIDRMVTNGLVERQLNPNSRREVLIDLTDLGSETVVNVTRRRRRRIARIVSRMPQPLSESLVDVVQSFNEAGGEPPVTDVTVEDY